MATLLGRYVLSTEGPVQLDYLKVNFQPKDKLIGGRVVGPLIAGSGVQVRFSCTILVHYICILSIYV